MLLTRIYPLPRKRFGAYGLVILLACLLLWTAIQLVNAATTYIVDVGANVTASDVITINGSPVFTYYDGAIKVATCSNPACETGTSSINTVVSNDYSANAIALADVSGNPFIAYSTSTQVKAAACIDPLCSLPAVITPVASVIFNNGRVEAVTVVNGNPLIVYTEMTGPGVNQSERLITAACVDPQCSTPATITTLYEDNSIIWGQDFHAAFTNNYPIISFIHNNKVKLAACANLLCTGTPYWRELDTGTAIRDLTMTLLNGNPVMAYQITGSPTKVAACSDPTCGTAPTLSTLSSLVSLHRVIANVAGTLMIASTPMGATAPLNLSTCQDAICSLITTVSLPISGNSKRDLHMLNAGGFPGISFLMSSYNTLYYYYGGDYTPTNVSTPSFTPSNTPTPNVTATPGQIGTLVPATALSNTSFGNSVAVSGDTIVIGAPYMGNGGKVYVYQWNGSIWTEQGVLAPSDTTAIHFGISVGIDDDTIVVGADWDTADGSFAGSAYVFTRSGNVWTQQQKLHPLNAHLGMLFGYSVAISGDTAVIGGLGDYENHIGGGATFIFTRSGSVWTQQQRLLAGDPIEHQEFGHSVDIYGDTVVIGAPGSQSSVYETLTGAAYVFVRSGGTWTQQQKLVYSGLHSQHAQDGFGWSVSIYNESIVVGSPFNESDQSNVGDDGEISVYNRVNGVWVLDTNLSNNAIKTAVPGSTPQNGGYAVDTYRETFLIGIPLKRDSSGSSSFSGGIEIAAMDRFSRYIINLVGISSLNGDEFGSSVARDGNVVVIGAPGTDIDGLTDVGAAYIFRVLAPPWEPTASLTPSPTATVVTPTAPPDVAPPQNYFNSTRIVTLTWNRVAGAYGYQVQVDDAADFSTPLDSQDLSADTLQYTTDSLDNGTYYWRICAKNSADICGGWSMTQSFVISVDS